MDQTHPRIFLLLTILIKVAILLLVFTVVTSVVAPPVAPLYSLIQLNNEVQGIDGTHHLVYNLMIFFTL